MSFSIIYIISMLVGVFVLKKKHKIELVDIFFSLIPLLIGCLLIMGVNAIKFNASIEAYTGETSIMLIQIGSLVVMFNMFGIKGVPKWFYIVLLLTVAVYLVSIYVESGICSKLMGGDLEEGFSLMDFYYLNDVFEKFFAVRNIARYISIALLDLSYILKSKKDKSKE